MKHSENMSKNKRLSAMKNRQKAERAKGAEGADKAKGAKKTGSQPVESQKIIAVCGIKNSGKTTLLTRLIRELSERGIRTAVVKHDGHDFTCDIPGTDSFRFIEAGAYGTGVYSGNRLFIHKVIEPDPEEISAWFPEADILFVEGMKGSCYPKVEVIRKELSSKPVSNPEGRFLIVTDWESGHFAEPAVRFEEVEEMIRRILEITQEEGGDCCCRL